MIVLEKTKIKQKIRRLAHEIIEQNYKAKEIVLAGINNNGMRFAKQLLKQLRSISEEKISLTQIKLNPADPLSSDIELDLDVKSLSGKTVIIVDDVANTGRTLFYALKPLMNILAIKIQMAVLVDRQHKSFPVKVDFVGLSLATTFQENIYVNLEKEFYVKLE